jgi:preprotein translocase subunit SecA
MLDLITKGISKIFGTKHDRDIKSLLPYLEQVKKEYAQLQSLSNDELRGRTTAIRHTIDNHLKMIDDQINDYKSKIENDFSLSVEQKEFIFSQIDKLELERNKELEKVLMDVLPMAFAVVKETARRFTENEIVEVAATDFDKILSAQKDHVEIVGSTAKWNTTWKVAGNPIKWAMVHYDVQLIGGMVLHQGKIAEMATGEGKTLVSTLPAFLNALARRGVHIVTVNDYLAKRDCEWNAPIFEFHGISVDCIDRYQANSPERRKAYQADITYGTNNEFGFDYLRDNMARGLDELVQRKHHFAMVDEVDSVLIDDARTPLIISGPVPKGDIHEFYELKPRVSKLVEAQKKLCNDYLVEAKKQIGAGLEKEGGLALFRAYRGLPKHKPLIKFLSEPGIKVILQKTENFYLQDNQREMPKADEPLYFTIDEKNNTVDLTDKGLNLITGEGNDADFFILPDLSTSMDKIEKDSSIAPDEKIDRKDQLIKDYTTKSERIHTVNQLLKSYCMFEKDVDYIIVDSKVKIVDEQTGRVLEGRRYSDGLHQAIEAKENVKVEDATQTYATVTLQNYFRMYHKLCGMTGTAETEAGEFWEIYKLDVVVVPTNKPTSRKDLEDVVYRTAREKYNAVVDEIVKLTTAGRPVLVGTTSVEISELLSRMLTLRKIKHQVLNAKLHQKEAEIVAEAGKPGTVTIATNMAGRGTDIKLTSESKDAGGLAIIGTERHESRRVDRQLRGRAGRQGDPGSSQFFVSLEDELMRLFGSERIAKLMVTLGIEEGEMIQHSMITNSIERAQKKVEENNFGMRKRLLEYDNVMNSQREIIYKRRRNALYGDRLPIDILDQIYNICEDLAKTYMVDKNLENLQLGVYRIFTFSAKCIETDLGKVTQEQLAQMLFTETINYYEQKKKVIAERVNRPLSDLYRDKGGVFENVMINFTDGNMEIPIISPLKKAVETEGMDVNSSVEKYATLAIIDQAWTQHLRDMDDLKQSVQSAVYEQKDPLLIYKFESFELFNRVVGKINEQISSFVFKAEIVNNNTEEVQEAKKITRRQALKETRNEISGPSPEHLQTQEAPKPMPIRSEKVAGRNDKVKVQYMNGEVKETKFKNVEEDVLSGKCVIIES